MHPIASSIPSQTSEASKPIPRISVITVVYNDLPGLKETMETLLRQHMTDVEWVVVDGGSRDGAPDFLAGLSLPFLNWVSEPDGGIYEAMNKGIGMAQGDFMVFMNAGDRFTDASVLSRVVERLEQHPDAEMILGGARLILPHGEAVQRWPRQIERYIWHGIPANHQAIYFSRARLQKTRYDLTYKICGDYYLVCELYRQGLNVAYIEDPLVDFRVGDTSYRHPVKLMLEPCAIQRRVLGQSPLMVARSLLKRLISTLGLRALAHPVWGSLFKRLLRVR